MRQKARSADSKKRILGARYKRKFVSGFFDEESFEEQLWTDARMEEVDREADFLGISRDEYQEIQDDIDSGLYSKEEIMEMHCLNETDLNEFDISAIDDDT